jgi:hypothetical protein
MSSKAPRTTSRPVSNKNVVRKARSRERGSSLIEFVLCVALFWFPFFLGMWRIGINLSRAIQVTEVCRDAAHMLAYGIDFSDPDNQAVLQKVAQGINLSSTGQGVVILSYVTFVDGTDCQSQGLQQNTSSCPNMNQLVFTRRIVMGKTSIRASAFGTPNAADMDSTGTIAPKTYLTDTTCRALGFSNLMTLSWGQYAYMAEMTLNSPDLGNTASSARSIF